MTLDCIVLAAAGLSLGWQILVGIVAGVLGGLWTRAVLNRKRSS
jgi:hypothetical protein